MPTRRSLIRAGCLIAGAALLPTQLFAAGGPGLTTHMLDTMNGKPAEGVTVDFSVLEDGAYKLVKTVKTNADGRTEPLLTEQTMKTGQYQLVFHIADYFARMGATLPDPPFVENAVIQFGISDARLHYHVPLLATPWSYTTYRGS